LSRSQKAFELMEECRRKGDIKPNERVYTSFIRALTRGKANKLHQKAFLILQRMRVFYDEGNKGIQPTAFTFNAVLNACAESRSEEDASSCLEAFKIALGVFNDLRKSRDGPDHVSFGNMIKCASLLPEGEQRNSVVSSTFRLCCEKGLVNTYVIRDLQHSASEDLWRSLLACPAGNVDMDRLPLSWSAKVERKEEKPQRPERPQRPQQKRGNFRR
jgi:hypothetical protein